MKYHALQFLTTMTISYLGARSEVTKSNKGYVVMYAHGVDQSSMSSLLKNHLKEGSTYTKKNVLSQMAHTERTRSKRKKRQRIQTLAGNWRRAPPVQTWMGMRLGRLNAKNFETYFINNYIIGTAPTKDPFSLTLTVLKTTSNRYANYYEPYWLNGQWILYTPISERYDNRHIWNHDFPGATDPAFSASWSLYHFCFPECLTIYRDFGPICAFRYVEHGHYWNVHYRNFTDYCELRYLNCAYYNYEYRIAHRGPCPKKIWEESWLPNANSITYMDIFYNTYYYGHLLPEVLWTADKLQDMDVYRLTGKLFNEFSLQRFDSTFKLDKPYRIHYPWYNYKIAGYEYFW